jgi:hypothetical protein
MVNQPQFSNNFNSFVHASPRPVRHGLIGFLRLAAPAPGYRFRQCRLFMVSPLVRSSLPALPRQVDRRFRGDTYERRILLSRALRASIGPCDGAIHSATLSSQRVERQTIAAEKNSLTFNFINCHFFTFAIRTFSFLTFCDSTFLRFRLLPLYNLHRAALRGRVDLCEWTSHQLAWRA